MTIPTVNGGAGTRLRNSGNDFMRNLILVLLAILFPCLASARIVENLYDTNNAATVDAHVITLISGPTNGASLATITNVIQGMVPTLSASNAVYWSGNGQRIFYVATNGNDATAVIGNVQFPYAANFSTNSGVTTLATNGDVIYLQPGVYHCGTITLKRGVNFVGSYRSSVTIISSNSEAGGPPSLPAFAFADNCSIRNLTWSTNPASSFSSFAGGEYSFTNVMIDSVNLRGKTDIFAHHAGNTQMQQFTIQNSTISSVGGGVNDIYAMPDVIGKVISKNNIYISDASTSPGLGVGNMAFEDEGSSFYNCTNFAGLSVTLHGSLIYSTNLVYLFANVTNSTANISGDYVDMLASPPRTFSLNPDRGSYYITGYVTNTVLNLDTNHLVVFGAGKTADNVTNTWNPTLNAWTNGGVYVATCSGFWQIGAVPICVGDDYSVPDSTSGILIDLQNQTSWGDDGGGAPTPKTWFPTNSITTNITALYGIQFNNGRLIESNGVYWAQSGFATRGTLQGNGVGVTNLIATNTVVPIQSMSSVTNQIRMNNAKWFLSASGPGALTNIDCTGPWNHTVLIVTNSSAVTNTFAVTAPFNKMNAVTTNSVHLEPGKAVYFMFDYILGKTNGWSSLQQ